MNQVKEITITFPDGNKVQKPYGITGLKIAEDISSSLAKESVAIEINNELRDLSYWGKADLFSVIKGCSAEDVLTKP